MFQKYNRHSSTECRNMKNVIPYPSTHQISFINSFLGFFINPDIEKQYLFYHTSLWSVIIVDIKHFEYLIVWREGTKRANETFPSHQLLGLDHDFSCRTNPRESHKRKPRVNVEAQHWKVPVSETLGK